MDFTKEYIFLRKNIIDNFIILEPYVCRRIIHLFFSLFIMMFISIDIKFLSLISFLLIQQIILMNLEV